MRELGVVKRADENAKNSEDEFERIKYKDDMAFKREGRDRDDAREERSAKIEMAKQETTKGMFSMMMNMSQEAKEPPKEEEKTEETPLPAAVMRAVVS